jgi:papilin
LIFLILFLSFFIKLKTNQGRFVLSSSGDLQIVQLHRTDSGTYVCVAYNGIGGSVEREIKLTVDGKLKNFTFA